METRFAITIDSALCAGYGVCVLDAPGVFSLDDDGVAYGPEATGDAAVLIAARTCPMGAITVVDTATGKVAA